MIGPKTALLHLNIGHTGCLLSAMAAASCCGGNVETTVMCIDLGEAAAGLAAQRTVTLPVSGCSAISGHHLYSAYMQGDEISRLRRLLQPADVLVSLALTQLSKTYPSTYHAECRDQAQDSIWHAG